MAEFWLEYDLFFAEVPETDGAHDKAFRVQLADSDDETTILFSLYNREKTEDHTQLWW